MIVWASANQKGGVGKTTTTITLSGMLAQKSQRVLMIDFDPHCSLTAYLGWDSDTIEDSSYQLFQAAAEHKLEYRVCQKVIMQTRIKRLSLIPGSLALATLDKRLSNLEGMGLVLKKTLHLVENDFDYVMIDCPPLVGILMINALATCDRLIVPVQTDYLSLKGLERMVKTIGMVAKSQHKTFQYTVLPTMFDKRTRASIQSLKVLRETYEDNIWTSAIPVDTRFRDASRAHMPPSIYDGNSRGVNAYDRFLRFLLKNEEVGASGVEEIL